MHEAKVLKQMSGCTGFARFIWFEEDSEYRYLVMTLMGPSLDFYLQRHSKFTLPTVVEVAKQLIKRLFDIHQADFLHRDLKPENMLTGTGSEKGTIFLIDFGL
jgi:serine/threonine protein kinase